MQYKNEFENAQEAFEYFYDYCLEHGVLFDGTKALFNIGFTIKNPLDRRIDTPWRGWKNTYAELEWEWYLSGDKSAEEIAKHAKIWYNMMDTNGVVNSNYGYQWRRNGQLDYVINELKRKKETRKASLSLYDGKEHELYTKDTICTYAIGFQIVNDKLDMSVMLRSNDLWYGFGNDQYCFSKLQEKVANEVGYPVGTYFHFAQNLHLYERDWDKKAKRTLKNEEVL